MRFKSIYRKGYLVEYNIVLIEDVIFSCVKDYMSRRDLKCLEC